MNRTLLGALAASLFLLAPAAVASAAAPDLRVRYISEPPSALQQGDQFTMTVQARNAGTSRARSSLARFYISADKTLEPGEVVATRNVHSMRRGRKTLFGARLTVAAATPADTSYYVFVCLDSNKQVKESNERNNCIGSATLLFVRAKPAV
jgi:subtilase family serine protease